MGVTVNCYSPARSRNFQLKQQNSMDNIDLLWAVDRNGQVTDRVYPLLQHRCDENLLDKCGAGAYCRNQDTARLVQCKYCLRNYHPLCAGLDKKGLGPGNQNWTCGCHISHADLSIVDRFSSKDKVQRLLESYSAEIKRHVASVLKFHLELALAASREDELNPCWLFQGDPYAYLNIPTYIARIASADKRFFTIPIDDRGTVVKNFLLPDVAAFLVHRLANIPLLCARRLVNDSAKYKIRL
eukprot:gene11023-19867_t